MNETEMLEMLETENAKLREENEMLFDVVAQMRVTLNRLIDRYIVENNAGI